MASSILQIGFFDPNPDFGIGQGGNPSKWSVSFGSATTSGSTIVVFSEYGAPGGASISTTADGAGNNYPFQDTLDNNAQVGLYSVSAVKVNAPVLAAGDSSIVTGGTSTTLTDSRRSGVWTLNQWAGAAYKNITSGDTGSVTSNTTTGVLTISGMGQVPASGQVYSVGGYIVTTAATAQDYWGSVAVEIGGCSTSALLGHSAVQNSYTTGTDNITSGTPTSWGTASGLVVCMSYRDVTGSPSATAGTGYTDKGQYCVFNLGTGFGRLESKSFSSAAAFAALQSCPANDHYQQFAVYVQDAAAAATPVLQPWQQKGAQGVFLIS